MVNSELRGDESCCLNVWHVGDLFLVPITSLKHGSVTCVKGLVAVANEALDPSIGRLTEGVYVVIIRTSVAFSELS